MEKNLILLKGRKRKSSEILELQSFAFAVRTRLHRKFFILALNQLLTLKKSM